MIGLYAFFYASCHFLIYLVLDQFFDWHTIIEDIGKRPYITVGFTALVLMSALAATSNRWAVKRLGKRWARLHALVYVIALAGIVHFTWSQKADIRRPTIYGIILVGLLALRLVVPRLQGRARRRVPLTALAGTVQPPRPAGGRRPAGWP
jgi:sulfoxide reductase heme-binding subunit YedZ